MSKLEMAPQQKADLHHLPGETQHVLIQFLTLRKLCWLVRSNISRKPMASLKKAVVRLRNLETHGVSCDLRHCSTGRTTSLLRSHSFFLNSTTNRIISELSAGNFVLKVKCKACNIQQQDFVLLGNVSSISIGIST